MTDAERKAKIEEIKGKIIDNSVNKKLLDEIKGLRDDLKGSTIAQSVTFEKLELQGIDVRFPDQPMKVDWQDMPTPDIKMDAPIVHVESPDVNVPAPIVDMSTFKIDIKSPMIAFSKSLEGLVTSLFTKVVALLREPDRIELNEDGYTEFYGNRTVNYIVTKRNGKIRQVVRNES